MDNYLIMALVATLGTWFVTALGAATVIFFTSTDPKGLNIMLGFASGVMIAASFWSLLQPAIERAEAASSQPAYLVATVGFLFGALFMWASDKIVSFTRREADSTLGKPNERMHRIIMLILSITLHNIPEGLAVGVAFGALQGSGYTAENLMGAISVAVGIGLQNFPEGAAVSVPLRREGCGNWFAEFPRRCGSFCPSPERRVFQKEKFSDRSSFRPCRADCRCHRGIIGCLRRSNSALCVILCGRSHDLGRCA